jgi:hypothetical protein
MPPGRRRRRGAAIAMIAAATISAKPPDDPILDWSALVEEGRATLEAMSDGRWTDFNAHDPGITILELVAYALTDLGYRANHPMADLLAGSTPLLGPAQSLTTRAVTLPDMRRVGLDVAGARNVWIEPASSAGVRLRYSPGASDLRFNEGPAQGTEEVELEGVHRVVIEKSAREDLAGADLAQGVAMRLHAQRNLGEDFDNFTVLQHQPIVIVADVEIDDPGRAEPVMAAIRAQLEEYLSPEPRRRTVTDLRGEGLSSDVIYDGPLLERGIVAELADPDGRRRILHLSDVIAVIAATTGVRATRRVRLGNSYKEADEGPVAWSLPIAEDRVAALDVQASRIRLLAGGAVALDSAQRPELMRGPAGQDRAGLAGAEAMRDDPPPAGRDRRLDAYRPLRLDLPATFGVRPGALARESTAERVAAANQLRAYLALFDAQLANLFAQLAGAKSLLALGGDTGNSYFAQPAESPSSETPIVSAGLSADGLQDLVERNGSPAARSRRNRFLGHLLARFGETVPGAARPVAAGHDGDQAAEDSLLLQTQEAFLRSFARVSAGRGSGANLLVEGDDSPLIDRIQLKLGLPPAAAGRILLVEHILLRGVADDQAAALPILSDAVAADPYSLQVSFVLDERLRANPGDEAIIGRIIREECPAHLIAYVRWLPAAEFEAFSKMHQRWMASLRTHRREQLGFAAP